MGNGAQSSLPVGLAYWIHMHHFTGPQGRPLRLVSVFLYSHRRK